MLKSHFSHNSKLGNIPCLDKSLKDCSNHCDVYNSKIAYCKTSRLNRFHKPKLYRNDKLFKSQNFIKVLQKEIRTLNTNKIRFFSMGDFSHISKKGDIEFKNSMDLIKLNPKIDFWVITRNFEVIYNYIEIQKNQLPGNISLMFSVPLTHNLHEFQDQFLKNNGIVLAKITDKKKDATCKASMNHKSCMENNCNDCFYTKKDTLFFVHGKYNYSRLKKWLNKFKS